METLKTILVVEDEPRIQRLIGTNLRRSGYRVLQAMNGHEAIIAVETQKTDLIILDTTLPDTAYWDLLVKLKQHEQPVIYGASVSVDDGLALYFTKLL
jgi:DNA-binding response OmpR family regulator